MTIKAVDKRNAMIIIDAESYKNVILNVMENNKYYEKIECYNPKKSLNNLSSLLQLHGKVLPDKEIDYLSNFKQKLSLFYRLPKIHTSLLINKACKEFPNLCIYIPTPELKLRPIIAGHCLSYFVDNLLKPFQIYVKCSFMDDFDMLSHLPSTVNEGTLLASLDVINLYTNIPRNYV